MIVYYVSGRKIIPVEAERITDKAVYIEGKRRQRYMGEASFHETEEEAKAIVQTKLKVFISDCDARIACLQEVKDIAEGELDAEILGVVTL